MNRGAARRLRSADGLTQARSSVEPAIAQALLILAVFIAFEALSLG